MRVLITGGSGFVGYWMHKTEPVGIDATYLNKEQYQSRWQYDKWDAIVHLAPVSPVRVLKYAYRYGTRILFASSGAVYGGLPNYQEYADNKRKWELACAQYDCVIARLFTFIGPRLNRHSAYEFVHMAKTGEIVVHSPDSVRSYLYGEDLGKWMWRLLGTGNGIYDVGGSVAYTMLEVAQIVSDVTDAKIRIEPTQPATSYIPDCRRAYALGCFETYGLHEAITNTFIDDCGGLGRAMDIADRNRYGV
jgi:nucleoside-diphosphate-sugar epimerase